MARRRLTQRGLGRGALVVAACCSVVLAGCGDDAATLRRELDGPPVRRPAPPNHAHIPPVPALLDTVQPYVAQKAYPAAQLATWQIASVRVAGGLAMTFRVPLNWTLTSAARAQNDAATILARATRTDLDDSHISLATYAAQLADGSPIYQYTTDSGNVVYVTRRVVALAPSDPDAVREVFHTAVTSINGKIAKLDVHYDTHLDWRFDELADAITGSVQVRAN